MRDSLCTHVDTATAHSLLDFPLSRNDGQMVSPLETSLDSVWRASIESARNWRPMLTVLSARIGVSLEGPKFLVLGNSCSNPHEVL